MKRYQLLLLMVSCLISIPCFQAQARYYDARTGRFLQTDPKVHKFLGWSPYNYALDNPLKYIDPDGNDVAFHESARNNPNFNKMLSLYMKTQLGSDQMKRFEGDHNVLVVYTVGNMSKSSKETIGAVTDWKTRAWEDSRQADQVVIGSEEMGIKDQSFQNDGKTVITVTLDEKILGSASTEKSAETLYHEGKAHIEYSRDKGDLTGSAFDADTEHKKYGTDGVSPVKKGSPADQFIKQVKAARKEEEKQQ
jgi:hypothetical protein